MRMFALMCVILMSFANVVFGAWPTDVATDIQVESTAGTAYGQYPVHDGSGGYYIVWHDDRLTTNTYDIYAQYYNSFGAPQWAADGLVICAGATSKTNKAAVSGGDLIVTFYDSDLYAQKVNKSGTLQWAAAGIKVIDSGSCGWVCTDGAGGAIVMDDNGYVNRIAANGSLPWGDSANAVQFSTDSGYIKICSDGAGGAFLVWQEADDIAVQRVNSSGTLVWNSGNPVMVTTDAAGARCPRIIPSGNGGCIVFWEDDRDTASTYLAYAQRYNGSGVAQWTAGGVEISTKQIASYESSLASDNAGGAFIIFEGNSDSNLYAQRITAGGTLWAADVPLTTVGNVFDISDSPTTGFSDGSGGAITIWTEYNGVDTYTVKAQRIDADGVVQWTDGGITVSSQSDQMYCVRGIDDGQGAVLITWLDDRNASTDIFTKEISKYGTVGTGGSSSSGCSFYKTAGFSGIALLLAAAGMLLYMRKH